MKRRHFLRGAGVTMGLPSDGEPAAEETAATEAPVEEAVKKEER